MKLVLDASQVLNIAHDIGDRTLEARAYAGLGHAARSKGDFGQAKAFHEQQLDNALQTKDKVSDMRICLRGGCRSGFVRLIHLGENFCFVRLVSL